MFIYNTNYDGFDTIFAALLQLISSYKSPVRSMTFVGSAYVDDSKRELIKDVLESHTCRLTYFNNPTFVLAYLNQFKARQKKRLVMITIASASSRVGRNSSLRRFPTELQRMLSIFL
jgi:hypothetical protein